MTDERKAFEAWWQHHKDLLRPRQPRDAALEIWDAATAAERERAAKVCGATRIVKGGEVFAAAIRRG